MVARCFLRRLHLTRASLRSSSKPPKKHHARAKLTNISDDNLNIPPLPSYSETSDVDGSQSGLTSQDISSINKMFLSRTKDLEPGLQVKELFQIRKEYHERYEARYCTPSMLWYGKYWKGVNENKKTFHKNLINSDLKNFKSINYHDKALFEVDPKDLMGEALKIGDLVLLKSHSSELCMCIDVPSNTKDPRYTFSAIDGTLRFSTRSAILLRLPHSLPESNSQSSLLLKEPKHGFEPIGTIKNSTDETFILPTITRQLVTSFIPQKISKDAWEQLPITLKKLELLHRHLQKSAGPWQLAFYNLVKMVQSLDLSNAITNNSEYLTQHIKECISSTDTTMDSAAFLATYWAIQAQQKTYLWGELHTNRALLSPISVTVLPFASYHVYYTEVLDKMKSNNYKEVNDFAQLVNNGDFQELPTSFPHIIELLKNYAAGNFQNIETIISLISKLFRKTDRFKNCDITRDVCHELLMKILPEETFSNPMHLNLALALPSSSKLTCSQQRIFDLSKPLSSNAEEKRHDFGSLKVYCIDSETAHEIDDGISIEDHGQGKYTLYIHIADPAALFSACISDEGSDIKDEILNVAFERGFTTYLPDVVVPMLPSTYCAAADLGNQGKKTKTMTFSIDMEVSRNDSLKLFFDTFQIRLGLVSNFPKVTYNSVDEILDQEAKPGDGSASQVQIELKSLHKISHLLRKSRVEDKNAVVFGSGFNKGLVQLSNDENGLLKEISFTDQQETASTLLVSEMMILANHLTGKYFKENNIPGVFRCYKSLVLGQQAQKEYNAMKVKIKKETLPTLKDINLLSSLLNSSFYSAEAYDHEMLGSSHYLTVTSPLRRFPDIVNHMQLHGFLRGLPLPFTGALMDKLVLHIQARDTILKNASRSAASYWTLKYLKDLMQKDMNKKFEVMVTSVPQVGVVRCVLTDFSSARGTLKLKPSETTYPLIGDTLKGCKITKIDCLDGLLELEL